MKQMVVQKTFVFPAGRDSSLEQNEHVPVWNHDIKHGQSFL